MVDRADIQASAGTVARREPSSPRSAGPGLPSRRVLAVMYHFPPLGGISMSRNVRNVQYLPRHGWTPTVLTPGNAAFVPVDPGSLRLVPPGTRVVRTRSIEAGHLRRVAVRAARAIAGVRSAGARAIDAGAPSRAGGSVPPAAGDAPAAAIAPTPAGEAASPPVPGASVAASSRGRPSRLARLRRLVFFPDDEIGWLPFAVAGGLRAHRAAPFHALFSTSFPITAHLVAGILSRTTGLPWVAEFRDPWVGSPLVPPLSPVQRRLQRRLERWIVRTADCVVCVTPSLTRMYRERYPGARIETVPNGYDRGETLPREPRSAGRRFRLVHTGTLYRPQEVRMFLQGLDRLLARRPRLADELEVVFYGSASSTCLDAADELLRDRPLGAVVRLAGFVPRPEAVRALAEADAGLVLLAAGPGMEVFVGGKVYDYLGQSLQILAVVPPGDVRDLLGELHWGVVADPDPAAVECAVEQLLTCPAPEREADPERRYDREALAGRLAALLDEVTDAPSRRTRTDRMGQA